MGTTENSEKNMDQHGVDGQENSSQNVGRRTLNGTYGDFFGGTGKDPKDEESSGGSVLVFGEEDAGQKEGSQKRPSSGQKDHGKAGRTGKESSRASGSRADALAEKGRDVVSTLSRRADALLGRQKEVSSQLKERTDALQRANDALREVQSLLNNPLYDGMPSLTGNSNMADPSSMTGSSETTDSSNVAGSSKTESSNTIEPSGLKEASEGASSLKEAANEAANEAADVAAGEEEKQQEPEKDPMEELDALIGLSKIKHDVKELTDFVKIQKLRKDGGLKSVPVSLHLVFTGNPGTGKTTVARILAKLYQKIGVLSKGQLIEVDRSGLVAGYVGQTALKTAKKIEEAKGGILFIDEAYSLARKDDTFGQEAIDTILKAMEDNREDFVVIVAGYTGPMENFINSNPGLKSRFNKYIEFPDYSIDELMGIFDMNCKKYDYEAQDDIRDQIRAMIVQRRFASRENFANAREVRNLFEEVITNQARRVAAMESPTQEDMKAILTDDLFETAEEDAARTLKKAQEMEASDAGTAGGAEQSEPEKSAGEGS